MRRNFLLVLAYDGGDFSGWQRLPGAGRSVQAEVEAALGSLFGEAIEIVGAGRTDKGVHAEGQAASFHAHTAHDCEAIASALNSVLPPDLACLSCREALPRFHARYRAKSKTYRYRLLHGGIPDPFLRRYSLRVGGRLDIGAMREAAAAFPGERDFRAFTNSKESGDTVRRLDRVEVVESGRLVDLVFEGPGFLYNQVRIMSSAILEAGLGRLGPGAIQDLLASRERAAVPGALPPHGLSLVRVGYDEGDFLRQERMPQPAHGPPHSPGTRAASRSGSNAASRSGSPPKPRRMPPTSM